MKCSSVFALLSFFIVTISHAQDSLAEAEFLKAVIQSTDKTLVADQEAQAQSESAVRLKRESQLMKRELSALRLEVAKLRAAARQAEAMKNAEVSGQKALVDRLRKELATARLQQAKSRQNMEEAHAEAALRIQRLRAMEEEVAKLTLARMEAEDQAAQSQIAATPKVIIKKDERYEDLLRRLTEVSRILNENLTEHKKAHR